MKILRLALGLSVGLVVISGLADAAAQRAAAPPLVPAAPQLAILDTDIGDDIDDAFALALALRSPELKLVGITTAFGDTELRARLVERFLESMCIFGEPVIAGISSPQKSVFTQAAYAHQDQDRLCLLDSAQLTATGSKPANTPAKVVPKRRDAVAFLLGQIRAHPGEITLIAIGPLTNVEAAIKRDPATFRKLKRVVLMGGSIYRGYGVGTPPEAEWNIKCDPAGLRALLASGVPVFMMPLDSTQIRLDTKERELIFAHGSPLTDQLTLLYHQWSANAGDHPQTPTLYDPVAVTYAIRPDLCPATPIRLEVDDKGVTHPVDGAPNAQVCLKSDEKGFLDLLLTRLNAEK